MLIACLKRSRLHVPIEIFNQGQVPRVIHAKKRWPFNSSRAWRSQHLFQKETPMKIGSAQRKQHAPISNPLDYKNYKNELVTSLPSPPHFPFHFPLVLSTQAIGLSFPSHQRATRSMCLETQINPSAYCLVLLSTTRERPFARPYSPVPPRHPSQLTCWACTSAPSTNS